MTHDSSHSSRPAGYEKRDANVVSLTLIVVVSVVVVVLAVVFVYDYFIATKEAIIYEQQLAPISPELEQLKADQQQALTSYGVIDSTAGIYRIPIEQAMELLAEEAGTGTRQ